MQEIREEQGRRKAEGKTAKYKSLKKRRSRKHGCSSNTDIAAEEDRKKAENNEVGCSNGTDIAAEEDIKNNEQQGGIFPKDGPQPEVLHPVVDDEEAVDSLSVLSSTVYRETVFIEEDGVATKEKCIPKRDENSTSSGSQLHSEVASYVEEELKLIQENYCLQKKSFQKWNLKCRKPCHQFSTRSTTTHRIRSWSSSKTCGNQEAVTIARQVAVQPEMPRIAQRQMHRNNAPAATPEGYFKINLTRVFLDHVLQQLNTRFQDDVFVCYKGISIIPSVLLATDPAWKANVLEFCNHFRQDIPNYAGLQAELLLWERLWKGRDNRGDIIPDSLEATLKDIDKDAYVNIYSMLKVLITIPISSASCERSISSLRNLKNYLRNTMTQDRLNGMALMHAHRDMDFDLECIIDLFAELHPRRMRMANIL
ncbi:52 kDa repressor of the inhibitor of the protein kinase-like [Pocillopora verrucosa]|uniref:52 kDa repressor of the inhibitor of the protein kinase-like n=1 Tax=Pocillopora verrucosa TaxID=203993 RepID=UPI003340BC0C